MTLGLFKRHIIGCVGSPVHNQTQDDVGDQPRSDEQRSVSSLKGLLPRLGRVASHISSSGARGIRAKRFGL